LSIVKCPEFSLNPTDLFTFMGCEPTSFPSTESYL